MSTHSTGNSKTQLEFDSSWLVLDIGSGHNPHERADVLVDRWLQADTNAGRAGRAAVSRAGIPFVVADISALPFREGAFDYAICSHVFEHLDDPDSAAAEVSRIALGGYVETPSAIAERLRPAPGHLWCVDKRRGKIRFRASSGEATSRLTRWFGAIYYCGTIHESRDDLGQIPGPLRPVVGLLARLLRWCWRRLPSIFYTRHTWSDSFGVTVSSP